MREPGDESCERIMRSPLLTRLSNVQPTDVEWLWPWRFALGKFSLISGDPGLGKSFLTLDLAARVSTGRNWPDGELNEAGSVILISAEDDVEDTVVPRLQAAGADLSKIVALTAVAVEDAETGAKTEHSFSLNDIDALEAAFRHLGDVRLVVVDPVSAFTQGVDTHKDSDIRGMIAPLCKLVAQYNAALIGVAHLNKNGGGSALYRSTGSLAWVAAARAAYVVTRDRDDPAGRRRLMLPSKNNLGPDHSGLAYELRTDMHRMPVLAWEESPVTITADEALAPPEPPKRQTKTDTCANWLAGQIKPGSRMPSADLEKAASEAGFKPGILRKAREDLGITADKIGSEWYAIRPA